MARIRIVNGSPMRPENASEFGRNATWSMETPDGAPIVSVALAMIVDPASRSISEPSDGAANLIPFLVKSDTVSV